MEASMDRGRKKTDNPFRRALAVVQENRRAYITFNAAYYGFVIAAMIYVAFNPEVQQQLLATVSESFSRGALSIARQAYEESRVLPAILATFLINLLLGSLAQLSLPSLLIPFSGLLVGFYRALMWGLLLSPASPELALPMLPHSITLILEGQAYVLVMLAIYSHGKAFLFPRSVGAGNHRNGYLEGLKQHGYLYVLVTLLLLIAAVYEALEVIYLVPLLV